VSATPPTPPPDEPTQSLPVPRADAEVTWASLESSAAPPAPLPDEAPSPAIRWTKALLPVAVLALYGIVKLTQGFDGFGGRDSLAGAPASLSGVAPEREEMSLTREQKALLERLEAFAAANRWPEVAAAVEAAPPQDRQHPLVRALALIARVETNTGPDPTLANEIEGARVALGTSSRHRELSERLALAEARCLLRLSRETFLANEERLNRLVRPLGLRPGVLSVRIDMARRYEALGDKELAAGSSMLSTDEARLRAARGYYQAALRLLVAEDRWLAATPIDAAATPHVQRILGRMAEANKALNGRLNRILGGDPSTWTGEKGDPVHDAPASR
jgi:hypothetical protein